METIERYSAIHKSFLKYHGEIIFHYDKFYKVEYEFIEGHLWAKASVASALDGFYSYIHIESLPDEVKEEYEKFKQKGRLKYLKALVDFQKQINGWQKEILEKMERR